MAVKVNLKGLYATLADKETGRRGEQVSIAQIAELAGDFGDALRDMPSEQAFATVGAIIERAGKRGR